MTKECEVLVWRDPDHLLIKEVATRENVAVSTVWRWVDAMPEMGVRVDMPQGAVILLKRKLLEKFLAERKSRLAGRKVMQRMKQGSLQEIREVLAAAE
ncbi:hypothetical protein [Roseomonas genomospecies 6]|uniref:Uncharacterized protein n=1 Tax=Roseomonas genomospecies 6 TaxID=214106 RepID=A0A9W7KQH7_9PROT|nr:hypothetical protein [Roseomonas genomospecies 6]KAA0677620.1 hypothetical protein DS843_22535 [Roseomonas genomospecies 6]